MPETVAVVRCAGYELPEVGEAVTRALDICGLKPSDFPARVLFKPNMLSDRKPEDGVTTHPAVLLALGKLLPSRILIGDSPANAEKPVEQCWDKCGYQAVAQVLKADLVKFDLPELVSLEMQGETITVPMARIAREIPLVNLPKMKTHSVTVLTLAVKNLYGLIPGYHKSILHSRFLSGEQFSLFLVRWYEKVREKVFFNLVDAVVIMEGNGPASGTLRRLGCLIAGKDAVAVDLACCRVLGLNCRKVPYLKIYEELYGLPEVVLKGDDTGSTRRFALPVSSTTGFLSRASALFPPLRKLARFFTFRPHVVETVCKRCYACVKVCPVQAVSQDLQINRKKCINCLCCFEVCPYRAIRIRKSFLARLFT